MATLDVCPTCHRPMPGSGRYLTERERAALSAWWWLKSTRAAATALGLSEQTVKNQLATARNRNDVHKTVELAYLFIRELDPVQAFRTSHNPTQHTSAA